MKLRSFLWLCLFLLLIVEQLSGREKLFQHFTTAQGLPSNNIYAIYQDKKYFTWLGTDGGLSRYDGTHFKNYRENDGLPDKDIMEVFGTSDGKIGVIGFNGKISFGTNDKFSPYHGKANADTFRTGLVNGVLTDKEGINWIWGEKLIEINSSYIHQWPRIIPQGEEKIQQFEEYEDGRYLVFLDHSIYTFHNGAVSPFASFDPKLKKDHTLGAFTFCKDIYAFYTASEVLLLKRNGARLIPLRVLKPKGRVNNVVKNRQNLLVAISGNGVCEYDSNLHSVSSNNYLLKSFIGKIYKDKEQGIWICTAEDGVYYLLDAEVYFFRTPPDFHFKSVRSIGSMPNGSLLLGFDDGSLISKDGNGFQICPSKSQSKSYDRILSIEQQKTNVWIGTDNSLYYMNDDFSTKTIPRLKAIKDIALASPQEDIVIAAYNGAFMLHCRTGHIDTFYKGRSTAILKDRKGRIWIGTPDGLLIKESDTITKYTSSDNTPLASYIVDIIETNSGIIWVLTNSKGLVSIKDTQYCTVDEKNGLPSNVCISACFDSDSMLWIATTAGISRVTYDPANLRLFKIQNYSQAVGNLRVNDIYLQNDTIWIGTDQGLAWFYKNWHPATEGQLPIHILSAGSQASSFLRDGSVLFPGNNDIEFSYIGISYKSNKPLSYQYRLLGLDTAWRYTQLTSVKYNNLKPGKYQFEVAAKTSSGKRSQLSTFHFMIKPAFWETAWFKIATGIFIIITLALLTGIVYRKQLKKEQLRRRLIELELEALRAQMNPHFVFNCLNSIQYYFLENDSKEAIYYLGKFSKLVRQTLEYSYRPFITLKEEIDFLQTYISLEQMKSDDNFSYDICFSAEVNPDEIYIPPLLLQIYVENAIKHGLKKLRTDNGYLNIRFSVDDGYLNCKIEDNGVGLKGTSVLKNSQHLSIGMQISQKRIDLLNTVYKHKIHLDVIDKSSQLHQSTGLIIHLQIPFYHEQLEDISTNC